MKMDFNLKQKKYVDNIKSVAENSTDNFIKEICDSNLNSLDKNREERIKKFGTNKLLIIKFNLFKKFFIGFIEPFNILLFCIGIANLFLYIFVERNIEELVGFCLVTFMVFLAVITNFIQEYRAHKINISLHKMVENDYHLINIEKNKLADCEVRDFLELSKKIKEDMITVGDILYFSVGDVIPADCKIILSNKLLVDQSQLTGESDPINKSEEFLNTENFIDLNNILYSQSLIKSGACLAIVVNISDNSYTGMISKISNSENIKTDFDKGISKITKIILLIIFTAFIFIFVASSLRTGKWIDGTILGITIVVALTPEALPAILSGNLQLGSRILRNNKVVVKKMNIIQNLGSVNILATDKTGTLTSEKIVFNDFHDFCDHREDEILKLFFINSKYQSSITNQIDNAIIEYGKSKKISIDDWEFVLEKEFDYVKRILTVVVKDKKNNEIIQITKGSVKEILNLVSEINLDGNIRKITLDDLSRIETDVNKHAANGQRTIAIATKILEKDKDIVEEDMIFQGIAMFDDEIKVGVTNAIKSIYDNNVDIKILSGDSFEVTKNIAEKIEMKNISGINGFELEEHDHRKIDDKNIFTKLSPIKKGEVINCLHENKHIVAYLGDGINDVLALKLSDVGISVNNGSSAAKQAADIIMLEKDLDVLNNAFKVGRKIFSNALKFIKLTVATNMGLMLTMLITSIWFGFRSMIPVQLLIQNLLFDFSNLFFVFDKVDAVSIKKPMQWNIKSFVPFVLLIALISTVISITNFLIMGYGFGMFNDINNNLNNQSQIQTFFFIESFVTHMVVILVCRTERVSIVKSNSSWIMIFGILLLFGILLCMVYIPHINDLFGLSNPRPIWWAVLGGLVLITWILLELEKTFYKKVFKSWI